MDFGVNAMAASTYLDQVQQLYIAYFGRPADTVGQAFWATQIDAANGSIASVLAGFSASAESVALFGNKSSVDKVTAIYQNVFNRAPEAAGLAYWVAQLDAGKVTQAQASWTIQQSAGAGDASAVANKLAAAKAFTAQIDTAAEIAGYNGAVSAASGRAYLSGVDSTAASLTNANAAAAAALAAASGTTPPVVTPPVVTPPVTTPKTFVVTENALSHVLEFTGTATGAVTVTASDATHLTFTREGVSTSSALNTVKGINIPSDAVSITTAIAANLQTANANQAIRFDASDAVTITGIASADETNALTLYTKANVGGSSVTLVAADGNWSVGAAALNTVLNAGGKLAGALTVTGILSIDEAFALINYSTATTGASSLLLTAQDGNWNVTAGTLTGVLAANQKLAGAVTVTGITGANEATALTTFTKATVGADSLTLGAGDGTWSVAAATLTTALAASQKLAGAVTVTGIASANEASALTAFTKTNVGADSVTLTAADGNWSVGATTLAAASTAGITLAAGDVVTINNLINQGLQSIGNSFQSGNDKLGFSGADLVGATGFVSASSAVNFVSVGNSRVELVIGTGVNLVASNAQAAFLFDTATHILSYDADGTGVGLAIPLLTLSGVRTLSATDFAVTAPVPS